MHVRNIKYNVNVKAMLGHITQKYPIFYLYKPFYMNVSKEYSKHLIFNARFSLANNYRKYSHIKKCMHGCGEIRQKGKIKNLTLGYLKRRRVIVLTLYVGIFTTYNYYTHIPTEIFSERLQNVHDIHLVYY